MFWDEEFEIGFEEQRDLEHDLSFQHGLEMERIINTQDINTFLEEISCPVCQMLVVSPVVCKTCEQTFCQACAASWLEKAASEQDCPCCRGHGVSSLYQSVDNGRRHGKFYTASCPKLLQSLLSKVRLECVYASRGCDEAISYDFLAKHESECGYQRLVCTNVRCNKHFLKKDIEQHHRECPYEPIGCPHCSRLVLRMEIDLHIQICEYRLVECCHCTQSYYAFEIRVHESDRCLFRPIDCTICRKTFTKLQLQSHTPLTCYKQLYEGQISVLRRLEERQEKLEGENKELKKNCQYLSKELLRYKQNRLEASEEQNRFKEDDLYDYPEDFESVDEEEQGARIGRAQQENARKLRAVAAATANAHIFGRETEDTSSFDEFLRPSRYSTHHSSRASERYGTGRNSQIASLVKKLFSDESVRCVQRQDEADQDKNLPTQPEPVQHQEEEEDDTARAGSNTNQILSSPKCSTLSISSPPPQPVLPPSHLKQCDMWQEIEELARAAQVTELISKTPSIALTNTLNQQQSTQSEAFQKVPPLIDNFFAEQQQQQQNAYSNNNLFFLEESRPSTAATVSLGTECTLKINLQ